MQLSKYETELLERCANNICHELINHSNTKTIPELREMMKLSGEIIAYLQKNRFKPFIDD